MTGAAGAALDEARGRLRLTAHQLDALALTVRSAAPETADQRRALDELRSAGILDGQDRVHPLAAQFVLAMTAPLIRMLVETSGPQGTSAAHVAVAGEDVWYSEPWPGSGPDDPVTYQRAELPTIVWDLGRLAGLHRSRVPAGATAVSAPAGLVDIVLEMASLGPAEWDDARTVALATTTTERWPDLDAQTRARWLAIVATLRSWWRVTVSWGDEGAGTGRWLSVLDCGADGYWRWDHPEDRTDDGVARVSLVPVSGGGLWEALQGLLPSSAELQAAVGHGRG
ncbi:hypothetical protein J1G43_02845 [Cellulomonas sp. zg-ZUI22]|uniref:hypothetical protein n=1 Tax=Cellulomonas sp. zg-ZUI22 TaxID=2816955 RepID=UPI001A93D01D|nr:hypothetical protein [Cellulomonas sp. zg-ZUI22]MBO0898903.1 hypothetical protein [Cellulomonas sp. zg-ZUI22]